MTHLPILIFLIRVSKMPTTIIDGKKIAIAIEKKLIPRLAKLKKKKLIPRLAIISVGDDKPSQTYIRRKFEAAKRVEVDFLLFKFSKNTTTAILCAKIKKIQKINKLTGLIVQLPLPKNINRAEVLNSIEPKIDVDCMTDANVGRLVMGTNFILPPTPAAVLEALKYAKVNLSGKNITLVGTGALVGKPLTTILMNTEATLHVCNSQTKNLKKACLSADIIISGVGKKDLIRGNMIKMGAVVIDTGICFIDGKVYGDANRAEMIKKSSYFTPTPGGIGPITVALLMKNTIICAEKMLKK